MKRRIIFMVLALVLVLSITCPAYAATTPRLVDNAYLLNEVECADILAELNAVSQRHHVDIVIVTTNTTGGKSNALYADDFFDNNGYGYSQNRDGILLLINMEDSAWELSTSGYGKTAITDDAIEHVGNEIEPDLGSGNYADAFRTYIKLCDEMIASARDGTPYKAPFNILSALLISLVIGLVIALIATGIMRGQLRSIRSKSGAADYVKADSMHISDARDMFLYRSIVRRPIPQNNGGSRRSSSGRSHGGGGGHF